VSTRFPSPAAAHSSLRAGIGLRAQHHADIVARKPAVGWFEAHSENYFAAGGAQRSYLAKIRADYALSLHGVGLSIGSTDPLNRARAAGLRCAEMRLDPSAPITAARGESQIRIRCRSFNNRLRP